MKQVGLVLLSGLLLVAGCGQFFPPQSSTGSSSSSGSSGNSAAGSFLYVANSNPDLNSVAGFELANSAMTTISGTPLTMPSSFTPTAMAITPNDDFLYVASPDGAIYVFVINASSGTIQIGNSGTPVATGVSPASLQVDTTGQWLIGVDSLSSEAYVFQIASSNGALTAVSSSTVTLNGASTAALPNQLAIAPNDALVFVALETAGVETLSFNSSTGALASLNTLSPKQNLDSVYSVAVAPSGGYLYVTETGINAVRALSISSNGNLTEISGSPFTTGLGPHAVLVDATGAYVYVANSTDGTISAFAASSTTGALTAIAGSPFATGINPTAMVEDKTKTYLAVVNQGDNTTQGGDPDLQVFSFSSTTPGALVSFQTATTGTDPTDAISIVGTH